MKVYGWDDTGIMRGDMAAANVDAKELEFSSEEVAARLGWEAIFSRFTVARNEMAKQMIECRVDPESVRLVKSLKASDITTIEE